MDWLWNTFIWLVMGGILGWLASILLKKNDSMNLVANIIAGVIGAWLGSWIAGLLNMSTGNWFVEFLFALVGAVIVVAVVSWFMGRRKA